MTPVLRTGWVGSAVLVVLALGVVSASPAFAHSALLSSTPGDGAALRTAPSSITLVFNENLQPAFTRVAVTRAGGSVTAGPARVAGARVEQPVAVTDAGDYTIAYRVVSADGHTVQGQLRFRYAAPVVATKSAPAAPVATVAPSTSVPASPSATASAAGDEGGGTWVYWGVLGPAVLALVSIAVILARNPSTRPRFDGGDPAGAGPDPSRAAQEPPAATATAGDDRPSP